MGRAEAIRHAVSAIGSTNSRSHGTRSYGHGYPRTARAPLRT